METTLSMKAISSAIVVLASMVGIHAGVLNYGNDHGILGLASFVLLMFALRIWSACMRPEVD